MDVSQQEPGGRVGIDLTAELELDARPPQADLHDPQQRREVEASLTRIPGVLATRIVPGFERDVDELHVVTTLSTTPKHTVRDVQTLLMAKHGVTTDHRVVSVVQLESGDGVSAPSESRVAIERVGLANAGLTVAAEVELRAGDARHRHVHEAAATTAGRHRAVAQATLAGVAALLGADDHALELDGVEVIEIGGVATAVTVLTRRSIRGTEILSGTAVVREAPADAVARAVLDATNRSLSRALG